MNFDMKKPCKSCPFSTFKDAVRLTMGRAEEIGEMMLSSDGGTFTCHSTFEKDERDRSHCAGALAFALKNGSMTQMMRIAERLRMVNFDEFEAGINQDVIIDDWEEMSYEGRMESDE